MISNLSIGQYIPGDSFLHKMDARVKLVISMILIILIFFVKSLGGYIAFAAFLIIAIAFSSIPIKLILKSIKSMWFVMALAFILNVFFQTGQTLIWEWSFVKLYKENLIRGAEMVVRLIMLVEITSLLSFTTSAKELTDAIELLFKPLAKIGFPVHEMALMMSIALRFIPTLINETDKIMKAQTARGAAFDSGSLISRIKDMIPILIPLFINSFKRADDLALAMEARCYSDSAKRTRLIEYHLSWRDYVAMGITAILLVLIIVGI